MNDTKSLRESALFSYPDRPMDPTSSPSITGLILAGGRGSRLGGVDKGWVETAGGPLICQVLTRLAPQVRRVLISANRNLDFYRALGPTVLTDRVPEMGPLAGIREGLAAITTPFLLVVPCDVPTPPSDLAERLYKEAVASGAVATVAHDGQREQWAFCLLRRELLEDLDQFLAAGERRLAQWLRRQPSLPCDFSDCAAAFDNLNTPADLARFKETRCVG